MAVKRVVVDILGSSKNYMDMILMKIWNDTSNLTSVKSGLQNSGRGLDFCKKLLKKTLESNQKIRLNLTAYLSIENLNLKLVPDGTSYD
jgi:hypothetical protein